MIRSSTQINGRINKTALRRALLAIFLLHASAIWGRAQEVGFKDLRPSSTERPSSDQEPPNPQPPNGCEKMNVGYADGETILKVPRQIQVELVSLDSDTLVVGSEVSATVKLRNAGSESITIPWSMDYRTTEEGQDPDHRAWEFAEFKISLRTGNNRFDRLKNTSQPLYGSRFVPGSMLTIKPGEWITVQTSFRVSEDNSAYDRVEEGPADLALEWFQTGRTHVVKNCAVMLGFYPFDSSYQHPNRVIVKKVEIKHSQNAQTPSR